MISLQGKTNFFEKRVGEYQKAGVMTGGAPAMFERLRRIAAFFFFSGGARNKSSQNSVATLTGCCNHCLGRVFIRGGIRGVGHIW